MDRGLASGGPAVLEGHRQEGRPSQSRLLDLEPVVGALFVVGFVLLFVLSGIGNGSTYKMMPEIFRSQALQQVAEGGNAEAADRRALRMSGALIGIAGAIGAFGGVLVDLAFRQSFMTTGTGDSADLVFIAFYVICVVVHLGRLPATEGAARRSLSRSRPSEGGATMPAWRSTCVRRAASTTWRRWSVPSGRTRTCAGA